MDISNITANTLTLDIYKYTLNYLKTLKKNDIIAKKKLIKYNEYIMKVCNKKLNNKKIIKRTGISANSNVPIEFKILFNLEDNLNLPRTSIAKLLHNYLNTNNLKSVDNNHIYKVDEKLKKIFKLSDEQFKYINETTKMKPTKKKFPIKEDYDNEMNEFKKGFNFFNFQSYLKIVYQN